MSRLQKKNWLTLGTIIIAVFLCVIAFAVTKVSAEDSSNEEVVVYDAADFEYLSNRTKEEITDRYAEALAAGGTYINGNSNTYYITPSSMVNPYNAGEITPDTLEAMEAMSNFCRWLVGANSFTVNQTSNSRMQAEALLRNFEFAHYISESSRPADMDDETWAAGYQCTHNILASGYTPLGAITGWLNEGYRLSSQTWDTTGHRYFILSPYEDTFIFGYSGRVAIGKQDTRNNTFQNAFSTFPAAGYMPSSLCSRSIAAWSVQLNSQILKYTNINNIAVTVTNLNTGNSYECTSANGYLNYDGYLLAFRQPNDGTSTSSAFTDSYQVEMTGLTDVATGNPAKICYTVDFFDMAAEKTFLSSARITLSPSDYCYTGEEIRPSFTVTNSNTTLTEGTDYEVEYYNNVEPGKGTVCVIGKGQYRGVVKALFTIREDTKNIEDCNISLSSYYFSYSGNPCEPSVTVTEFGNTLIQDQDYTVTYSDNINAGNATATISGIGEYHGVVEKSFTISQTYSSLNIKSYPGTIEKGGTYQMNCTGTGAITYQSSDESIFTVDENGLLTGVSEGTATLTVTANGDANHYSYSRTISVTVSTDVHTMQTIAFADGETMLPEENVLSVGKKKNLRQ